MPHLFESATICILKQHDQTAWSGFLISPQVVITCAHTADRATTNLREVDEFGCWLRNPVARKRSLPEQ